MKELNLSVDTSHRPVGSSASRAQVLLLASLSISALLTIMAPIAANRGLHVGFNQAWADGDGGEGGGQGGR